MLYVAAGVEGHAEGLTKLNEHQLARLHGVLGPFMLRRVKTDVASEMAAKKEIMLYCSLSSRQQVNLGVEGVGGNFPSR